MSKSVDSKLRRNAMGNIATAIREMESAKIALSRLVKGDSSAGEKSHEGASKVLDSLRWLWDQVRSDEQPLLPNTVPMQSLWNGPGGGTPAA